MKTLTRFVIAFSACSALALTALAGPESLPRDSSKDKEVMAAPAPPTATWSGFYIGLNAGGTFSQDNNVDTDGTPGFAAPTFASESNVSAALATASLGSEDGQFLGARCISQHERETCCRQHRGNASLHGFPPYGLVSGSGAASQGAAIPWLRSHCTRNLRNTLFRPVFIRGFRVQTGRGTKLDQV